mgnify:FL=1
MEKKNPAPGAEERAKAPEGKKFYPDVEFNRKERRKTLFLAAALIILLGGMSIVTFMGQGGQVSLIMGLLMVMFLVFGISMIPGAFKQYPVKNEPLLEVYPKEVVIGDKRVKPSDILSVRLTISLPSAKTKAENEQLIEMASKEEPERGMTADLDFTLKNMTKKDKAVYLTISCAYEALLALYAAGVKHYQIVYSLKKISRVSTYRLENSESEDGVKLGEISKKDRLKQLY